MDVITHDLVDDVDEHGLNSMGNSCEVVKATIESVATKNVHLGYCKS